jgi:hypothetical protein
MKTENREQGTGNSTSAFSAAEETLRLLARLSAPEGLEERVQAGLRAAATTASTKARILRWPAALQLSNLWQSSLMRVAAAAAIVAVVLGGGWLVSSRFQPAQPATAIALPPHASVQGGFSSAGAMRTPQTLNGPILEPPATPHPAAPEPHPALAAPPAAAPNQASAAPSSAHPATHPAKPHHRLKPGSANKPIAHPAPPPTQAPRSSTPKNHHRPWEAES